MPYKVTIAPQALAALRSARAYLLQPGSGKFGRKRWTDLQAAPAILESQPYLGRPSPDHPGLLQLIVADHTLIYRIRTDEADPSRILELRLLAVFGPGQQTKP
jgi:plasmid stabilization system protein ParE